MHTQLHTNPGKRVRGNERCACTVIKLCGIRRRDKAWRLGVNHLYPVRSCSPADREARILGIFGDMTSCNCEHGLPGWCRSGIEVRWIVRMVEWSGDSGQREPERAAATRLVVELATIKARTNLKAERERRSRVRNDHSKTSPLSAAPKPTPTNTAAGSTARNECSLAHEASTRTINVAAQECECPQDEHLPQRTPPARRTQTAAAAVYSVRTRQRASTPDAHAREERMK
ncbi:hypothetical protein B0H16DRAFT_1697479 [Mycena metata]|uniref:Uncharacterized protein n=1 Tax=Mycena metata TaxID=1033252 RepID=A0AAD7MR69_9AGAR|nr:hypothetical protein B0H16DRAFT_1697479 [Mycena metata]